jgi:hypothetical protein
VGATLKAFIFWTLVLAGNLGLAAWIVRRGPRIWASLQSAADMFAPGADWPALLTAGAIALALWIVA